MTDPWEGYIDFDDYDDDLTPPEFCDGLTPVRHAQVGTVMCLLCGGAFEDADLPFDQHAKNRDALRAHITGMQMSGRSTKTVILPAIAKRAAQPRRKGGRRAR